MHGGRALICAITFLAAVPARADEMEVVQSTTPHLHTYQNRSVDILGIKLGMSPDEVTKILTDEYGAAPKVSHGTVGIVFKSIRMSTKPFISEMSVSKNKGQDNITVNFAYPSTGGGVIGLMRGIDFPDPLSAPTVKQMFDQMQVKYGPSSLAAPKSFDPGLIFESWAFNATAAIKCPQDNCPSAANFILPSTVSIYRNTVKDGIDIVISGEVFRSQQDSDRVSKVRIIIDDQEDKILSYDELDKQLKAAAELAYSSKAVPSAAPRL